MLQFHPSLPPRSRQVQNSLNSAWVIQQFSHHSLILIMKYKFIYFLNTASTLNVKRCRPLVDTLTVVEVSVCSSKVIK